MRESISIDQLVGNDIKVTNINAQYDACAKKLLSNKIILSYILKETVEEFKGMSVEEITPLIEGEPYISEVSVEPGETNPIMHSGNRILGSNTENAELGEGNTDLLNVVLVGLDKELTKSALAEAESDLHYLLGTLFSNKIEVGEKLDLLNIRFSMKKEEQKIREELDDMCNLSYGILQEGIEQGIERGIVQGIGAVIREMLLDHQTYAQIKKYTGASENTIREIENSLSAEK